MLSSLRQTPAGRLVRKALHPVRQKLRRARQTIRSARHGDPKARAKIADTVKSSIRSAGSYAARGIRRVHSISRSIRNLGQV